MNEENIDNTIKELEIEKIKLEIKHLKTSSIKLVIIQAFTTVMTTFLILFITWFLNREYISLSLDVKRLKSEKENLQIELRKDSLSELAKEYLDSAIILKKKIEIIDLRKRVAIVSEMGLMEFRLFFGVNKAIEKYSETKNSNYLFSEYVKNIKLIENIGLRYALYSSGEQMNDTLYRIFKNKLILWKQIVPKLESFGKLNAETKADTIDKYIKNYRVLYNQHYEMMRNYFVNDTTGELEILEIP